MTATDIIETLAQAILDESDFVGDKYDGLVVWLGLFGEDRAQAARTLRIGGYGVSPSRCDMPQCEDPALVVASETQDGPSTHHWVRVTRESVLRAREGAKAAIDLGALVALDHLEDALDA